MIRTFFLLLCCMFSAVSLQAAQTCKSDSIPASTPDSQLVDNGDGTVTDSKTGLMWKKCIEGVFGNNCENGITTLFTWQQALQHPETINVGIGFAGYNDWRLPNIRELISIIEEQCYEPAINLNRFPNTPSSTSASIIWSGSPYLIGGYDGFAWYVNFYHGLSYVTYRSGNFYYYGDPNITYNGIGFAVRLVRGGN